MSLSSYILREVVVIILVLGNLYFVVVSIFFYSCCCDDVSGAVAVVAIKIREEVKLLAPAPVVDVTPLIVTNLVDGEYQT